MLKAWLTTILALIIVSVAYYTDLLNFFSGKAVFYIALAVLILTVAAAGIILGNPFQGKTKDDEDGE